jgi:hypothetical protein
MPLMHEPNGKAPSAADYRRLAERANTAWVRDALLALVDSGHMTRRRARRGAQASRILAAGSQTRSTGQEIRDIGANDGLQIWVLRQAKGECPLEG